MALPQCHWTDGGLFDLEAIGQACRERKIGFSLDVTQSAGALPIDVRRIQPDFLTAATYKWLLGPYSLGLLYVSERWQQEGRPIEHNWIARKDSENFARLVDYQDDVRRRGPGASTWASGRTSPWFRGPRRRSARSWSGGSRTSRRRWARLTDTIAERAQRARALQPAAARPSGRHTILGLKLPGGPPPNLLEALARRKVYVSIRGASVRVTPHVYNGARDIETLIGALEEALG